MALSVNDNDVKIIRDTIIEFLKEMKRNKRRVEQEIKERTEAILSDFISTGATQITFSEVQDLSREYQKAFLEYYRNTIHLQIIANAADKIRGSLLLGFKQKDILPEEFYDSLQKMRSEMGQIEEFKNQAIIYEKKIKELEKTIEQLSQGEQISSEDYEAFQKALAERDQIIIQRNQLLAEKDEEIFNLNQGLSRMEAQVMQLGEAALNNTVEMDRLREAIGERDEIIEKLQKQLEESNANANEIIVLKEKLTQAEEKIRELEVSASSISNELVDKLQDDLETSREQILALKKEIVEKNDQLHKMQLNHEELVLTAKNSQERLNEVETSMEQLKRKLEELTDENEKIKPLLEDKDREIEKLNHSLLDITNKYNTLKAEMDKYEGKISISTDEQNELNQKIKSLEKQIEESNKTFEYIKGQLAKDLRFKTLAIIDSVDSELRTDDIALSLKLPTSVINKIIAELYTNEMVNIRHEGRHTFVSSLIKDTPLKMLID